MREIQRLSIRFAMNIKVKTNEDDVDNVEMNNTTNDNDETQKLNEKNHNLQDDVKILNRKIRRKCIKNLLAFSFSYFVQFSA